MEKYRKKPIEIEAEQWNSFEDVPSAHIQPYTAETGRACKKCQTGMELHGWVKTLEGGHIVCPGDWIIKGVKGEFYPCKPDIFGLTYERAEDNVESGDIDPNYEQALADKQIEFKQ